jgi:ribosomal protein L40E
MHRALGGMHLERCRSCGAENSGDAEYCVHCGTHLGGFRRCRDCGIVNRPDATSCRICGAKLVGECQTPRATPSERPGYRPRSATCGKCGRRYDGNMVECPYCERTLPETHDPAARGSGLPVAAGSLLFVAGILCIIMGMLVLGSLAEMVVDAADVYFCSYFEFLLGAIAITGWVFCMQRRHLVYVVCVCVATMFSIGPFFLSSLLGLVALVLVVISAKEFR